MPTPESKTCTRCELEKPLSEFQKNWNLCRPCEAERRKDWYTANREAHLAYQREWRARNKERKAEKDREWRERNVDRKRTNDQRYRAENREQIDVTIKAWRDANPQRVFDWRRDRRARMRDAFVAPVRFDAILIRDVGICGICDQQILESTVELDHIIPLAAGGTHEPGNVQLAHRSCNRRKWMKVA